MRSAVIALALIFITCCVVSASKIERSEVVVKAGSHKTLTVANFTRIRQFILRQGQRQTYCQKYNNNPHWAFNGFNAYLNPPDQRNIRCEIGKSDFPWLVFQTTMPHQKIRYWHVKLTEATKTILIQQLYAKVNREKILKEAARLFQQALMEIDKQEISNRLRIERAQ
jgi:hypothetical protein